MKSLLTYWVAGCLIIGLGVGVRSSRCPDERFDWTKLTAMVAIWPTVIGAAIIAVKLDRETFPLVSEGVCR